MLDERAFFMRRAFGWVLREFAQPRPDDVYAWLLERRQRAAGLTLREAIMHLPEAKRRELLARRPSRRSRADTGSSSDG